jgi:UDP-N-acetylmuramate--alanine ligase
LADSVAERLQPGDVVLTLGAGDITRLGPEILDRLGA